jgi:GT2 family glycosyltransferase
MKPESVPLVSVVILNCNGKKLLERCLSSVLVSGQINIEVIVVDNGSIDGSVDYIQRKFGEDSRLRIVSNGANFGVAEGHNVGILQSHGRYIAFLDNDTQVSLNWISNLAKVLESDSTVGAVQGKIMLMDNNAFFDSTGGFIDFYGISCERGNRKRDVGQFENSTEVFHSKCSAMMVRKQALDEVGLFDRFYFTHYDDTDLCWRMWLRGYRVLYVPSAFVLHNVSYTALELRLDQVYYLCKNCITTLMKNYESRNLLKYLPGLLTLESSRSFFYFVKRDKRSLSLTKAIIWNLTNFRKIWKARINIQKKIRRIPDEQIMTNLMIKPPSFPLRFLRRIVTCE